MLLKNSNTNRAILNNALSFLKKRKLLVGLFLFTLYTVLILGVGYTLKKNNFYGQILKPILSKNYKGFINYFESFSVDQEKIVIDIKAVDYYKLAYKRQEALKKNRLRYSPNEESWVPATVTHREKILNASIRLKGLTFSHWQDPIAWSFKIKLKGDDTLFGMKRFALQGPWNRGFMQEWYLHKLLQHNSLIALRYDFVEVILNGKHLPMYAIEENFEKRLLENNNLREGPIFWADLAPLASSPIRFYQPNKYEQNVEFMKMVQMAENRIEYFRQGSLPLAKVFDVNKMGKLLALTDLLGDYHLLPSSAEFPQLRFYYNPVTGLIEPIAYDSFGLPAADDSTFIGSGRRFTDRGNNDSDWLWPLVLFRDKLFFKKYIESLEKISDKTYLDRFFSEIEGEAQEKVNLLNRSYPWRTVDKRENFYKNSERIRQVLQPKKSLTIHFDGVSREEGILYLEIANTHFFPVEVLGISLDDVITIKPLKETIVQAKQAVEKDKDAWRLIATCNNCSRDRAFRTFNDKHISFQDWVVDATDVALKEISTLVNLLPMVSINEKKINQNPQSEKLSGLEYEKIKFTIPGELEWSDDLIPRLRVISRVFGARSKTSNKITPWARHEGMFVQPDNVKETFFMSVDEENKLIRLKQGEWTVDQDIIIPRGYQVIADQGTRLDLKNGAKIVSYSALKFIGSKDRPIVISSKENSGQGVVVMETKGKSIIQNTIFDGLSSPNQGGWGLTGAVTFYESPVTFSNVKFINISSEDGLNIIRSEFTLEDTVFRNLSSDALDSDFSKGTIRNASFFDCKNDALDASGSEIHIESIFLNNIEDKGISAGEKSRIFIDKLVSKNTRMAVVSKDQSEVFIQEATVENSKIGLAAFVKKPEFGPGSIEIKNFKMNNLETPFLIEVGSTLVIDGIPIAAQSEGVGKLLYGG